MKKLIFIAFCTFFAFTAKAQNVTFEIGGGLASHYGGSSKSVGAFKIGVGLEVEMEGMWSIKPSLLFYAKGWKNKNQTVYKRDEAGNIIVNTAGTPQTGVKNITAAANYLELPILVNYYIETRPHQYIRLSAGPYIAYGVGGKVSTKGDTDKSGAERWFYEDKTFKEEGTHRFDGGLQAAVAYEFNRQLSAGIEADFGLLNFNNDGAKNIATLITFAYRLGK